MYIPQSKSVTSTDYYPFGIAMKERTFGAKDRYGFNGKENDDETETQDYGKRIYNEDLGIFLAVDPLQKKFAYYTPYQFAGNTPIMAMDIDGLEPECMISKNGHLTKPIMALLNAALQYDMENMEKTTWRGVDKVNYKNSQAMTVGNEVEYKNNMNKDDQHGFWLALIAHEQEHINEIGNINTDPLGAAGWLVMYGAGFLGANCNYENNPYEKRVFMGGITNGPMEELFAKKGMEISNILNMKISVDQKTVKLKIIGLDFRYEKCQKAYESLAKIQDKGAKEQMRFFKKEMQEISSQLKDAKKEEAELDKKDNKANKTTESETKK